MKIESFDPPYTDNIGNFQFKDPDSDTEDRFYCIGYKLIDPENRALENSWEFDHANYWIGAVDTPVTREKVEQVLTNNNTTLEELLKKYLKLIVS